MFGYITPLKDELKVRELELFKSYYCGLCMHIKKNFGNLPRMCLNYDMTFLALIFDSLSTKHISIAKQHCLVHPLKKRPMILENQALSYAASMNVALVYYKLLDDVTDDKSLKSKALSQCLASYQSKFSPDIKQLNHVIEINLKLLYTLEQTQNFSCLDEICAPFSLIVAHIFKAYPYPLEDDSLELRNNLFDFGYALGKWIYLIDALDDLKKDMAKNKFNPLHYLYNKECLPYEDFLPQIKDTVEFTILNCGYSCSEYLNVLPIHRHHDILNNIIYLGMMDKYTQIISAPHQPSKERN